MSEEQDPKAYMRSLGYPFKEVFEDATLTHEEKLELMLGFIGMRLSAMEHSISRIR